MMSSVEDSRDFIFFSIFINLSSESLTVLVALLAAVCASLAAFRASVAFSLAWSTVDLTSLRVLSMVWICSLRFPKSDLIEA